MLRQERAIAVRLASALTLAACVAVPTTARAAAVAPRPCERLAISPAFAQDGTVFCGGRRSSSVVGGTTAGFVLFRSSDRGHSWTQLAATGLPFSALDDLHQLLVSPTYMTDHTVVVQTLAYGTFVSADSGATFVPLLPADGPLLTLGVMGVAAPGAPAVGHAFALGAGSTVSPTGSVLMDLTSHAVTPVPGVDKGEQAFAVSPSYVADGRALAFAQRVVDGVQRTEVYACDATFACATRTATLPGHYTFDRAWFVTAKLVVVALAHEGTSRPLVYGSSDGGRTWAPLAAAQHLLDGQASTSSRMGLDLAATPSGRRLWLRTSSGRAPQLRVYRSDDAGRTWLLAASATIGGRRPTGNFPDIRTPPPWYVPRVSMQAGEDGHLFVNGLDASGWDVACSADNGRSWATYCRA
jgi:hypothetical protein